MTWTQQLATSTHAHQPAHIQLRLRRIKRPLSNTLLLWLVKQLRVHEVSTAKERRSSERLLRCLSGEQVLNGSFNRFVESCFARPPPAIMNNAGFAGQDAISRVHFARAFRCGLKACL